MHSFGAQNQRQRPGKHCIFKGCRSVRIKADTQVSHIAQRFEGAGQIDHDAQRHMLKPARSGLGEYASHMRRMPLRGDDGVHREGGGGAHDGANIMWIGDLIEHQHQSLGREIGDIQRFEGASLQQQPLMHRISRQAG